MKYELEDFSKNRIKKIQKNFLKEKEITKEETKTQNFLEEERERTRSQNKLIVYQRKLDNKEIEEKDIPEEYVEDLKKLYNDKIDNIKRKLNSKK